MKKTGIVIIRKKLFKKNQISGVRCLKSMHDCRNTQDNFRHITLLVFFKLSQELSNRKEQLKRKHIKYPQASRQRGMKTLHTRRHEKTEKLSFKNHTLKLVGLIISKTSNVNNKHTKNN